MKGVEYTYCRHYSPILLHQQQTYPNKILQKSPSPLLKNSLKGEETFDIKINKIISYNNRDRRVRHSEKGTELANRRLKNIFEPHNSSKIIFSQENISQKEYIQEYSNKQEDKIKNNVSKKVLIKQGFQGDMHLQLTNLNENKSSQKINRFLLKEQIKGLNQSMDLTVVANNNIIFDKIQNKVQREKDNFILKSYKNKKKQNQSDDKNERQSIIIDNHSNYYPQNFLQNQNSLNNLQLSETSPLCTQSKIRQQQNPQQNQDIINEDTLKANQQTNQKIQISIDQTTPRSVFQYTQHENSQPINGNKSLQRISSQTRSQFEYSLDHYLKRCITAQNEGKLINQQRNCSESIRKRNQKSPQQDHLVSQVRQSSGEQDFKTSLQTQFKLRDSVSMHQKILEEYQNDTLVKRESPPPIQSCSLSIQNTQISKKYYKFLRNQKNKINISQKLQFSPQKPVYNNQSTPFNQKGYQQNSEKLPDIKKIPSVSDRINEYFDQQIRESPDFSELNLSIRRLDTETEVVKQKRKNAVNSHIGQRSFQLLKTTNNTEKFYKKYTQNLYNNQNNHLLTEQISSSIISYNDFQNNSYNHNNHIYTENVLDVHNDNIQVTDVSAFGYDIKNLSDNSLNKFNQQQIQSQNILKQQNNLEIQQSPQKEPNINQKYSSQINIFNSTNYQNIQQNNQNKIILSFNESINQNKTNDQNSTINLNNINLGQIVNKNQNQQINQFRKTTITKNIAIDEQTKQNQSDNQNQIKNDNLGFENKKLKSNDKIYKSQTIAENEKNEQNQDCNYINHQVDNTLCNDQNQTITENQLNSEYQETLNQNSQTQRKFNTTINENTNQNETINECQTMYKTMSQMNQSIDYMNQSVTQINKSMDYINSSMTLMNQSINTIQLKAFDEKQGTQIHNRNSQKLLQFIQLQPQVQQMQYFQQTQHIQPYQQQIITHNQQTESQFLGGNIKQQPSFSNKYNIFNKNNIHNTNYQNSSLSIQYQSPESISKRRVHHNRNLSGVKQNLNKAIQISRLDLSSNSRDCVYYSLNNSQNFNCDTSQDKVIFNNNDRIKLNHINQLIQNNQNKQLVYQQKTINTNYSDQEDQSKLQFSISLAHQNQQQSHMIQQVSQQNQQQSNDQKQQHINHKKYRKQHKQILKTENNLNIIENGFNDDTNPLQTTWNQFSIEDYVSQMKISKLNQGKNINEENQN